MFMFMADKSTRHQPMNTRKSNRERHESERSQYQQSPRPDERGPKKKSAEQTKMTSAPVDHTEERENKAMCVLEGLLLVPVSNKKQQSEESGDWKILIHSTVNWKPIHRQRHACPEH